MLDAIGQVLPLAVVVALSPTPIIAVIVVLLGADAVRRGWALLVGRMAGIVLVVAVFTLFAEYIVAVGLSPVIAAVVTIVFGLALVIVGVVGLTPRRTRDAPPRWIASLERMTASRAAVFGFVLALANPKVLAMGTAAGLTIGGLLAEVGKALVVGAVYTIVAVLGVAVPVVAVTVLGARVGGTLRSIRTWLDRNSAVLMAILLLVFGAILLGHGLSGLG